MSKSKQREFKLEGTTVPLVDGVVREFTLVGVVTEDVTQDAVTSHDNEWKGNKFISTSVIEYVDETAYTLSVGLSVLNPIDLDMQSNEGYLRAKGRALKPGKALYTLSTSDRVFSDTFVQLILNDTRDLISRNPNKYIKVSVPKNKVSTPPLSGTLNLQSMSGLYVNATLTKGTK